MPIFTKKFAPKVAPPRTQRLNIGCPPHQEDLDDFRTIRLNLVDKQLCFVDGVWMSALRGAGGGTSGAGGGPGGGAALTSTTIDDLLRMKRRIKALEQENNLYQVKLDVLLDLLTENVIELNTLKEQ
ncbi:chibby [Culex quinquefasciatus]|uniref:Chibby n=2 Tax=Culex pipiens complex TaxID=518105 RepID=B0W614_CULQU|nr:protein chibby homolog 1-like [Culex pipiens pallens]EDS36001.1 chibby [Culex quinquefasciatus]|eukprot:XP_001844148.1 chibby [Culex quinquefasciatus]